MKRHLDQYDIEAEREALAIKNSMKVANKPKKRAKVLDRSMVISSPENKKPVVVKRWIVNRGWNSKVTL